MFLGGGLGSMLRFAVYRLARGLDVAWGTMIVNVVGGMAAGLAAGWLLSRHGSPASPASLFVMTGLLGGFTTFSAFSLDAVLLWQKGQGTAAAVYVMSSVLLSIAGVIAGLSAARLLA